MQLEFLFSPHGTISRGRYLLLGLGLMLLKFALDATFSLGVFGEPWHLRDYLWPRFSMLRLQENGPRLFVATMLTVAAPFAWIGVCLTIQRLRAIQAPVWLVLFFFVPFVKFLFFAILCAIPSRSRLPIASEGVREVTGWRRWLPESALGSAFLAVTLSGLFGCCLVALMVNGVRAYSGSLFVGVPFLLGFLASLLHNARCPRTWLQSIGVALLAVFMVAIGLLVIAIEGVFCLLMAAPLAILLGIAGGLVGHALPSAAPRQSASPLFSLALFFPLLSWVETRTVFPPQTCSVSSEVTIHASPEQVWPHVIDFAEIEPPNEWIFRAGIAYPIRAIIDGQGVGAIRHCIFSTGEFVEPITTWDKPNQLAFEVSAQPDPLKELSPYRHLRAVHLDGYFQSQRGEFHLSRQGENRTLLRGTTWYVNRIEPQFYWRIWSNFVIHRIHQRVLEHIQSEVETAKRL